MVLSMKVLNFGCVTIWKKSEIMTKMCFAQIYAYKREKGRGFILKSDYVP